MAAAHSIADPCAIEKKGTLPTRAVSAAFDERERDKRGSAFKLIAQ